MTFKGTIIITDPCYIMRADDSNDWDNCDYGRNMKALGINTYISESTIYGDWKCTTYQSNDPKKTVDELAEICKYFDKKYEEYGDKITDEQRQSLYDECKAKQDALNLNTKPLGRFCADAGMVAVFLLDEVLAYNPDFKEWVDELPWCVTMIKDFEGDVKYYIDSADNAHIIGTGSTNFFTIQTAF